MIAHQLIFCQNAFSGVDLWGSVQRVSIADDGSIWFVIDHPDAAKYCRPGWFEMNMYIPANNPQYSFYYGLVITSLIKQKNLVLPNLDKFGGTGACDITKTGYGLTIVK